MAISSYGASTDSSGVVRILKDLDINIEGRHVLVIEDIIDSGLTLSYLVRNLESREPASLEVCALLTKPDRREIDVDVRYVGLRDPEPVRDRLRPRLRRALPQPAVRRRPPRRPDAGRRLRMPSRAIRPVQRWPAATASSKREVCPPGNRLRYPERRGFRESFLPQRIHPAHRDRPARLAREQDADPEEQQLGVGIQTYSQLAAGDQAGRAEVQGGRLQPEQALDHGDRGRTARRRSRVHYPSDQSALEFQNLLDEHKRHRSTRRASAASRGRR